MSHESREVAATEHSLQSDRRCNAVAIDLLGVAASIESQTPPPPPGNPEVVAPVRTLSFGPDLLLAGFRRSDGRPRTSAQRCASSPLGFPTVAHLWTLPMSNESRESTSRPHPRPWDRRCNAVAMLYYFASLPPLIRHDQPLRPDETVNLLRMIPKLLHLYGRRPRDRSCYAPVSTLRRQTKNFPPTSCVFAARLPNLTIRGLYS
jgi:hypothetical protein